MLNQRDADDILFGSELEDGDAARNRRMASVPKDLRQFLIRENPESVDAKSAAAIEIQRTYRGYRARANLYDTLEPKVSNTAQYGGSQHIITREEDFQEGMDKMETIEEPVSEVLGKEYEDYLSQMQEAGVEASDILPFEAFSSKENQDWWNKNKQKSPSQMSQKSQEKEVPQQPKRRIPPSERAAAIMIQRAWRRHIDIQVYRYYRDLINFKMRGNPSWMLRCINPNEAKLLDTACGVHIKFRLAGERFPPNIYYKIFTHRPIQDLCSNSPKDYTKPAAKLLMMKDVHNDIRNVPRMDNKEGWYKREDNNGWRLVSDRLIHHAMSDPVTWETSHKKYEYHHDKLQRKQDVEKRKKEKKIEWMKKMYRDGMLKAKSDDPETINLIEGAAAGMVATVDKLGSDAVEDWEVDELLDWTTSLNFDEYLVTWKEMATSAHSAKIMEEKARLYTATVDPYEFASTAPSRFQSSQQSRNTPASSISGQGSKIPLNT